jgi:hypothetical protein
LDLLSLIIQLTAVALAIGAVSYFFFGNSYWFSTAEHVYLGGNTAIILSGNVQALYNGGYAQILNGHWSLIIPCFIGALAFTRWTRFRWSARYATAVLSGIGVGLVVGLQVEASIVGMINATVIDVVGSTGLDVVSRVVAIVGFLAVITYYLYSKRLSGPVREGNFKFISRLGTYFLLLTAGYLYANVFMVEGIDLLSTNFIMWFPRSIFAINQYMSTSAALDVATLTSTITSTLTGNVALSTGAVAVVGISSYAVYRKRR